MNDGARESLEQRLVARIDALASRVEEQARVIAEQSACIAAQRARIGLLEGAAASPGRSEPDGVAGVGGKRARGRREVVKRLLGAAAAATVLAVAKEPPTASAYVRGTILGSGGSTPAYGFVSTGGTEDPLRNLPPLGNHLFGLIGTTSAQSPPPTFSSAVAGFANTHGGIMGLSSSNVGAYGQSSSHTGVSGVSESNAGVYGQSASHAGVYGSSPVTGVVGVGSQGAGVQGVSTQGVGVLGESVSNFGVYGSSPYASVYGTSPTIGVWGRTTTGSAILGQVTDPNGWAGQFQGNVYVNGSLTVIGPFHQSTAVAHPDGSHRRIYSQGSAEPFFEDVGRGTLVNGQATIQLDPDLVAMVDASDYLVFLTEIGNAGGLFVASQTATSFTVQSRAASTTEVGFAYRLIFRRRDVSARRLEAVRLIEPVEPQPKPKTIDPNIRVRPVVVDGPDVPR